MRKRIFVALNLEGDALNAIESIVDELQPKFAARAGRSIRFVSRDNWHLTVSFLGYQEETDIPRIVEAMKRTAKDFGEQKIVFRKLLYGPPGRAPRMIWLVTDSNISRELSGLKTELENNLEKSGINFGREMRQFTGHLTLARFDNFDNRGEALPQIERDINIRSTAGTLDLMESELKRSGAEYTVLQKIRFKQDLI